MKTTNTGKPQGRRAQDPRCGFLWFTSTSPPPTHLNTKELVEGGADDHLIVTLALRVVGLGGCVLRYFSGVAHIRIHW